jgi:membrane-associated protease RseP (regulator of RpoE activity)
MSNDVAQPPPDSPPPPEAGLGRESPSTLMPSDAVEIRLPRKRRVAMPAILFVATCLSTFWVGAVDWKPLVHLDALLRGIHVFAENMHQGEPMAALWQALSVAQMNWRQGLIYMLAVLGILLTHEMGHFLMAVRHRIPASLPYFIPLPIIPFGTMGAVIGMEGSRANRREMFDLGVAGPLAGLAVALPITLLGIWQLPAVPAQGDSFCFHNPLLFQYLIAWLRPEYPTPAFLYLNQFNPFLMAGWMGMLVTGLNMLPISQLDGGHVAYAVLGERGAHILARGLLIVAILFIIATEKYLWVVMLVLVILLGTDHPPTADDRCRLGRVRTVIGWLALLIPILCFPPLGITPVGQ